MSRKFKSQASSARAASSAFGQTTSGLTFGAPQSFQTTSSPLSHVAEFPDLHSISDSRISLALKNLGKKDSTTKTKALEELQECLANNTESWKDNEGGFLDAWTSLYPRAAIDNARRVRLLAHSLQGTVTTLAGKRVVPCLPKLIGSWLSGTFDSDRGVARTARDALDKAFPNHERRQALWKIYKEALVEYVEDAALVQTPQTLSDERTTSPDDAEAKHVRVAGNALLMFTQLLQSLYSDEHEKPYLSALSLLSRDSLWLYAYHADPFVRRSVYRLLVLCAEHYPDSLPWSEISTALLSKALHVSQLGTAAPLSTALLAVTKARPEVWTRDYSAKTPASRRLFQLLRQGSQRSTEAFWKNLKNLLQIVPASVYVSEQTNNDRIAIADCRLLLKALHEGVSNREEPRQNLTAAWQTYVETCFWLIDRTGDKAACQELSSEFLFPLLEQAIFEEAKESQWSMPSDTTWLILPKIIQSSFEKRSAELLSSFASSLANKVTEQMKLSLPETSKDFRTSQEAVIRKSTRLAQLQKELRHANRLQPEETPSVSDALHNLTKSLIIAAINVIGSRNGKPYSAAQLLTLEVPLIDSAEEFVDLDGFLETTAPTLLSSPSADYLIQTIFLSRQRSCFSSSLRRLTASLLELSDSEQSTHTMTTFASLLRPGDLSVDEGLQNLILDQVDGALRGEESRWQVLDAFLKNSNFRATPVSNGTSTLGSSENVQELILNKILSGLTLDSASDATMVGLQKVLSSSNVLTTRLSSSLVQDITTSLLILRDSPDEKTAERASTMLKSLKAARTIHDSSSMSTTTIDLIKAQLDGSGQLLSIFSLIDLAIETYNSTPSEEQGTIAINLLPSRQQWQSAVEPFLAQTPIPELAITSCLGGLISAIEGNSGDIGTEIRRDAEDLSLAFRLGLFTTKLILSTNIANHATGERSWALIEYLSVVSQLANDKITLETANTLWLSSTSEVTEEAALLVTESRETLSLFLGSASQVSSLSEIPLARRISELEEMHDLGSAAFHQAEAFSNLPSLVSASWVNATHDRAWQRITTDLRKLASYFSNGFWLVTFRDEIISATQGRRLLNELIAEATAINPENISAKSLMPVIMLNLVIMSGDELLELTPSHRLMMLVKTLLSIANHLDVPTSLSSEVFKLLTPVAQAISDVYGEHWDSMLSVVTRIFSSNVDLDTELPLLHSSLKLTSCIERLSGHDEVNEDLFESWSTSQKAIQDGLIHSLHQFKKPNAYDSQPREITANLLRRQLQRVDINPAEIANLAPLLVSPEISIHLTAYDLMHRAIPASQEQLSLDVVLEGKTAQLPTELMSLISRPPIDFAPTSTHDDHAPLDIRRILIAWKLVFDHFTKASYKLREMYAQNIKDSLSLPKFLDLFCDIIKITTSHPLIPPRTLSISNWESNDFADLGDTTNLAIHLFHEALLYLPSQTKAWFFEQKNRTKDPLQSWTSTHVSPLIKTTALTSAQEWSTTSQSDPTNRPLQITISPKSFELSARIEIDPESAPIALSITLPPSYPLDPATIHSRTRGLVPEKTWSAWLRTVQLIVLASGSLIEGLVAFRRNVQASLKGHSECAICYAIIGEDLTTPNKRCGTCRNCFHGVCLFRWFRSSNSSKCPLCRNTWSYAGGD